MQLRALEPETAADVSGEDIDAARYDCSAVEIIFDPKAIASQRLQPGAFQADGNGLGSGKISWLVKETVFHDQRMLDSSMAEVKTADDAHTSKAQRSDPLWRRSGASA